ncbi:MAG: FAD-dependent oxidoreductase [Planctomycetota bacterium]
MKIAIIGAGISGLVAAYRLQKHHQIDIFEANSYVGGHTNTIAVQEKNNELAVDTGFIVFNDRTYPNFIKLLAEWGVEYQKTLMSFSVKCDRTGLEYRGADFNGLFAQRTNLFNPKFLRLLYDLVRFKKIANPLLRDQDNVETVGSFLHRHGFSEPFIEQYFLPMGSAIWSCPTGTFMDFPIAFITEFYHNHGLLGVSDRPQWYVIKGGSKQYVVKLLQQLDANIRTDYAIQKVTRAGDSVELHVADSVHRYDHVVMACHADQALDLLHGSATEIEREILSAFPYGKNIATLHTQSDVLPKNRRAWAAWNYHRGLVERDQASVTYNMNILQGIRSNKTYCVTLNDSGSILEQNIIRQIPYAHPIFNVRRKAMQKRHHELVGHQKISYCGAYWGNGFHEDGVVSGLAVADSLLNNKPDEAVVERV